MVKRTYLLAIPFGKHLKFAVKIINNKIAVYKTTSEKKALNYFFKVFPVNKNSGIRAYIYGDDTVLLVDRTFLPYLRKDKLRLSLDVDGKSVGSARIRYGKNRMLKKITLAVLSGAAIGLTLSQLHKRIEHKVKKVGKLSARVYFQSMSVCYDAIAEIGNLDHAILYELLFDRTPQSDQEYPTDWKNKDKLEEWIQLNAGVVKHRSEKEAYDFINMRCMGQPLTTCLNFDTNADIYRKLFSKEPRLDQVYPTSWTQEALIEWVASLEYIDSISKADTQLFLMFKCHQIHTWYTVYTNAIIHEDQVLTYISHRGSARNLGTLLFTEPPDTYPDWEDKSKIKEWLSSKLMSKMEYIKVFDKVANRVRMLEHVSKTCKNYPHGIISCK